MSDQSNCAKRLRRQLWIVMFIRRGLAGMALYCVIWGAVVLAARAYGVEQGVLLWGLPGLIPVIYLAVRYANAVTPGEAKLEALIDVRSGCGGMLMASYETDMRGWERTMPNVTRPEVDWRGARIVGQFLFAAAFVTLSFFMPQQFTQASPEGEMRIDEKIQQAKKQIEALKKEKLIDEKKAEQLVQKLDGIRNSASANDPVKTWQALDQVDRQLREAAAKAIEQAKAAGRNLADAQTLANVILKDQLSAKPGINPEAAGEVLKKLEKTVSELIRKNPELIKELAKQKIDPKMLKALIDQFAKAAEQNRKNTNQANGQKPGNHGKPGQNLQNAQNGKSRGGDMLQLTPEQMRQLGQLARMAGQMRDQLQNNLQNLGDVRLLRPGQLNRALQQIPVPQDAGALVRLLKSPQGQQLAGQMLRQFMNPANSQRGGRGGISRGGGPTPLSLTTPTDPKDFKFKAQKLKAAELSLRKKDRTIGVSVGAPKLIKDADTTSSARLNQSAASGGSSTKQTVLPRHRAVVEKFFERK